MNVMLYKSTNSSNSIPSYVADGFAMADRRRSSFNAASSIRFHEQFLLYAQHQQINLSLIINFK